MYYSVTVLILNSYTIFRKQRGAHDSGLRVSVSFDP
jgi:hypothetical protein